MYGIEDGTGQAKGQILSGDAEERHFFENIKNSSRPDNFYIVSQLRLRVLLSDIILVRAQGLLEFRLWEDVDGRGNIKIEIT